MKIFTTAGATVCLLAMIGDAEAKLGERNLQTVCSRYTGSPCIGYSYGCSAEYCSDSSDNNNSGGDENTEDSDCAQNLVCYSSFVPGCEDCTQTAATTYSDPAYVQQWYPETTNYAEQYTEGYTAYQNYYPTEEYYTATYTGSQYIPQDTLDWTQFYTPGNFEEGRMEKTYGYLAKYGYQGFDDPSQYYELSSSKAAKRWSPKALSKAFKYTEQNNAAVWTEMYTNLGRPEIAVQAANRALENGDYTPAEYIDFVGRTWANWIPKNTIKGLDKTGMSEAEWQTFAVGVMTDYSPDALKAVYDQYINVPEYDQYYASALEQVDEYRVDYAKDYTKRVEWL